MLLSLQEWLLIAIVAAAVILIIGNVLRPDLVAILVLATLPLTGIVTYQESLSGFSRSVVITIIGLFIITQTLEDTGIVQWLAERLRHIGAGSETRLLLLFMTTGAALSLMMNNIAAGAVLLPAAVQVGRESNVPPSRLLIPVAFGTLVGGMATYFTTANIILGSILRDQGQPSLGMLDFLPTGGLIAVAGIVFMALIGRHWLPRHESAAQMASAYTLSRSLYETYHLPEQLQEIYVPPQAALVNLSLDDSKIGAQYGLTVIAIWRGHQALLNPAPTQTIQANDYLLVLGDAERVAALQTLGAELGRSDGHFHAQQATYVDLTEILIPPRSSVIGKSLTALNFRGKYHLTAVALWRRGVSYRTDVGRLPLEVGDALLMVGSPQQIKALSREPDFLVMRSSHAARPPLPQKASWALAITGLVLLASIVEWVPTPEAMMLGVAALALTGCINLDEAYRAIGWRVIFLIAGMLPVSIAMVKTGLAERLGNALVLALSPFGPLAVIAGMFLITTGVTQVIGGQVAALIIGPIAVTAALQVGSNAQAMAVAVAIACSTAFLTPIAHPVNVLMMSPGGYTARDFVKVGSGMTLMTFVLLLVGMRLFWGV